MRATAAMLWIVLAACQRPPRAEVPVQASEGYATTSDGVRLYYRTVGSGSEVVIAPFALFHGTSLDGLFTEVEGGELLGQPS